MTIILLGSIFALFIVLYIWDAMERNKQTNRIRRNEEALRYNKPNSSKWWER